MKKTVAILMIFCLLMSLCGCDRGEIQLEPPNDGRPKDPPPVVIVTIDGKRPNCIGGSSWDWYRLKGNMIVEACGLRVHPLDMEYKPFKTSVGRAELHFSELPDSFSATAIPNVPKGEPRDDVQTIYLTIEDHSFALLEGDYIYEIHASWEYWDKGASGYRAFNAIYLPENIKNTV